MEYTRANTLSQSNELNHLRSSQKGLNHIFFPPPRLLFTTTPPLFPFISLSSSHPLFSPTFFLPPMLFPPLFPHPFLSIRQHITLNSEPMLRSNFPTPNPSYIFTPLPPHPGYFFSHPPIPSAPMLPHPHPC